MEEEDALAKGIGLVVFGLLWLLTNDLIASALIGFGTYLIVKGVRPWTKRRKER